MTVGCQSDFMAQCMLLHSNRLLPDRTTRTNGIVGVYDFAAFKLGMTFVPQKIMGGDVWILMGDRK